MGENSYTIIFCGLIKTGHLNYNKNIFFYREDLIPLLTKSVMN